MSLVLKRQTGTKKQARYRWRGIENTVKLVEKCGVKAILIVAVDLAERVVGGKRARL